MTDAFICDAVRTPIGRYGGALSSVRPDDLAATIYHLLGIDPHTEVRNTQQRPVLVAEGQPVMDILA